jgi:hypothetical protein
VTITNGSVAIGQAVGASDAVTFAGVTAPLTGNVTGNVSGNAGTVTNGVYTTSSVTDLNDVSSVGSGAIITTAERTLLNSVENSADVTDAANVDAAGALMDGDFTANGIMKRTAAGTYAAAVADTDFQGVLSEGAFADGDKTKLDGIATGATANQTDAHLLGRANHTGTQAAATISDFDTEVSNNTSVVANTAKVSADGLVTTHSDVSSAGSGAIITSAERSLLSSVENSADVTDATNVEAAGALMDGDFTANGIMKRTAAGTYAAAVADTDYQGVLSEGAFADGDKTKLDGIATGATANQTDAHLLARANHTGTQAASTISDFDAEVTNNTSVVANTAKVSADGLVTTHSDVSSAGSGAIITTAERTLLSSVENSADVTDAANVAAAGAVMNTGDETIAGTKTFSSAIQGNVTGQVSDMSNHDTDDLSEGSTNLYFTDARSRAAVSATDAGGDGSFSYNSTTGVMTYTGPSAADARAHFTGGTGVTITNGAVAIGQSVATTDAVTFASATTTGNAAVGGTLDVTGAGQFDSTLGSDGNLRVGSAGASKFSVDAASGGITTSGDLVMTNGTIVAGALQVTGATSLTSVDVSTMSVSTTLTVPTPSFGLAAANKSYVDTEIDSHTHDMPQAYSYLSSVYEDMGADLTSDGAGTVTITVTGANLAAGTIKLHLDGAEFEVTETVNSTTEISFTLTRANMLTMTARAGVVVPQLSIDGIASGLSVFVKL